MTLPSEPKRPAADRHLVAEPMRRWERVGALAAGLALAGVGCVAVFKTDNQAGTTALLLAAGVFLLIGIQGTSLVRVSGGSNTAEFERRLRQERFIEAAAQEAETNPERAKGMMEGAAILDPAIAPVLHSAITWNNVLKDALIEAAAPCQVSSRRFFGSGPVKFDIRAPEGMIPVIPKPLGEAVTDNDLRILDIYLGAPAGIGGLIVGSTETTAYLQLILATRGAPNPIEVVTWAGPADNEHLAKAIRRIRKSAQVTRRHTQVCEEQEE